MEGKDNQWILAGLGTKLLADTVENWDTMSLATAKQIANTADKNTWDDVIPNPCQNNCIIHAP